MNNRLYDWDQDHPRIKWLVSVVVFLIAMMIGMVSVRGQFGVEQPIFQLSSFPTQPITITVAENLTNYPVLIPLTSTNFDFSAGSVAGNDIRFLDSDHSTPLNYWIEGWDAYLMRFARVWVKIPLIQSGVDKTIYVGRSPGGSDQSNITNVFPVAWDFAMGITNGLVLSTAGNANISIESPTKWFGNTLRIDAWTRYLNNPVLPRGSGWETGVDRDLYLLVDTNNNLVRENGRLVGLYLGGLTAAADTAVGRATSTNGVNWEKYPSNPVLTKGAGGTWDAGRVGAGTFMKVGTGDYRVFYTGADATYMGQVGLAFSSDGTNWSKYASNPIISSNAYTGPLTAMGVCNVIRLSSGTYFMALEGIPTNSDWRIYGATSTDLTNWTAFNGGNPILTQTGAGWESSGVANPKLIEMSANNYFLAYNARTSVPGDMNALGVAYSTDLTTWTRFASNPILNISPQSWDSDGMEQGSLYPQIILGGRRVMKGYYQGFSNFSTDGDTGMLEIYQDTRLYCYGGTASTDGWLIGIDLDAYPQNFEVRAMMDDGQLDGGSTSLMNPLMLLDSATPVAVTDNATFNPMSRVQILRNPWNRTTKGFAVVYFDAGGTPQYWNGSTWTTSTFFTGFGRAMCSILDDGTNYKITVSNENGVPLFAQASIAKSSVKAFSNGRVVAIGEPYNNFYNAGQYIEHLAVRYKGTNEPTVTVTYP